MKTSRFYIVLFFFFAFTHSFATFSQDVKDELDSLEATPEEDLSGLDDLTASPESSTDDDLPPDDDVPPAPENQPQQAEPAQKEEQPQTPTEEDLPPEDLKETQPPPPVVEPVQPLEEEALPEESSGDDLSDELGDVIEEDVSGATVQGGEEAKVLDQSEGTTEALTGVLNETTAKVVSLQFKQLKDRVRLIIKSDRSVDFEKIVRKDRKQVIVELRNATLSKSTLSRVLDTSEFDGPVALVQPFKSKVGALASVKVLFQLRRMVEPKINRSGSELYVDFMIGSSTASRLFKEDSAEEAPTFPETFLAVDGKARYSGSRISLNVKDAELVDVLSLISKVSNKNFVLGDAISKKVTLSVRDTPWDQILAIILVNNKLGYQKVGNIYRILQAEQIKAEMADIAKSFEARADVMPLETRLIPINYARANDVQTNVKDLQSKRGKISIDSRTNSIVVTDTSDNLEKILTYIQSIDKQAALVEIQARVVEARENFVRSLNLDWTAGPVGSGSLAGSRASLADTVDPDATGGNLNLRLGSLGSLGSLTTILGIAESQDQVKIIASPRVVVLDNRTATISRGDQFNRVTPPNDQGVSTVQSINANLSLSVTPQVTADGYVLMNVNFQRNTPDESSNDGSAISTRSATTEMMVESGKTGVIGGIYVVDKNSGTKGWPLLKSLPILGSLFTNEKTATERMSELLMFISPKILNTDKAFLSYKEAVPEASGQSSASAGELEDLDF
jgi:type IV pilus assembly protein PilQ